MMKDPQATAAGRTNAIQRNRRGPMSRRSSGGDGRRTTTATATTNSNGSINIKKSPSVNGKSRSGGGRSGTGGGRSGVVQDLHQQPQDQRRHFFSSSQPQQKHQYQQLSTHMDQDDREILIESALGRNQQHYTNEKLQHLKSRKPYSGSSSYSTGHSSNGSFSSLKRPSYSPLRGRDIFTEEEMKSLTPLKPESIFDPPPIVKKHKKIVLRIMVVLLGMLFYFVIVTTSSNFKQTNMKRLKSTKNQSVEANANINSASSKKVFKDGNVGRYKVSSKDKTMDMSYNYPGEDDMVNQDALQKVQVNKVNKAIVNKKQMSKDKSVEEEQIKMTTNERYEQKEEEAADQGGISPEEMHDDHLDFDDEMKSLAKQLITGENYNVKDNAVNHAILAQIESKSKPQVDDGSRNDKAIKVDTSKTADNKLIEELMNAKVVIPSQYNLNSTTTVSMNTIYSSQSKMEKKKQGGNDQ